MDNVEYLPLGSMVLLKEGTKKLMIISRCLILKVNGENRLFDYGGVQYPEGLMGDKIAYFNNDGIVEIINKGYSDEEDQKLTAKLTSYIKTSDIKKGQRRR